jgi:hypothetical protein
MAALPIDRAAHLESGREYLRGHQENRGASDSQSAKRTMADTAVQPKLARGPACCAEPLILVSKRFLDANRKSTSFENAFA